MVTQARRPITHVVPTTPAGRLATGLATALATAFAFVLASIGSPVLSSATAAADCPGARLIPAPANIARVEAATLCLIDRQRAAHGLAPLRRNAHLQAAARTHAAQMVTGDYFDHVSPGGDGPLLRAIDAGYASRAGIRDLGENIAAASGSLATPAAAVALWMRSPRHRAEILNPAFRDTGIGVAAGVPASLGIGRSGATYAEDFGRRG